MALTICTCTLNIKNILSQSYSTAELVFQLRKSMVDPTTGVYLSRPVRASAVAGVCTLALAETTTDSQLGVFTLNYFDDNNYGSITFDPIMIPNQATLDLSTVLTVSRG